MYVYLHVYIYTYIHNTLYVVTVNHTSFLAIWRFHQLRN